MIPQLHPPEIGWTHQAKVLPAWGYKMGELAINPWVLPCTLLVYAGEFHTAAGNPVGSCALAMVPQLLADNRTLTALDLRFCGVCDGAALPPLSISPKPIS